MTEINQKNEVQKEEVIKRGRGRPKKDSPPVFKEKKKMGRRRKYEEGYHNHTKMKTKTKTTENPANKQTNQSNE